VGESCLKVFRFLLKENRQIDKIAGSFHKYFRVWLSIVGYAINRQLKVLVFVLEVPFRF
jgi:hypothetical protein